MPDTLISPEQMQELLESIWSSMLFLPLRPLPQGCDAAGLSRLSASVHISGDWNGSVVLHVTERFARLAAARMLDVTEDDLQEADVHDAAAELCNIVGGSIKCLLPGRNTLSLPSTIKGADFLLRIPRMRLVAALDVESAGQPLSVRLLEATG
jgi:hypothetical protein